MSSTATGPAGTGSKVIQLLAARPVGSRSEAVTTDAKLSETHASTTIMERIANARRGYLAWLALEAASINGQDP